MSSAAQQQGTVGPRLEEVRAWARSRGYPVDESSAVPLSVLRAYQRVRTRT